MRVTLINNPGAGKQGRDNGKKLVAMLAEHGYDVRYCSSKEDGWKKALKKPADLVVVAGGDGTVARVARRMVGRGIPMALLPSGTANNIARSLGQVERAFEELVRAWPKARRVKLDVGVARGPWGERRFVEGVGAGVFAELLGKPAGAQAKKKARPVENALERLKTAATRSKPLEIAAELDGRDISGRYLMLEAINLPYVGPNLHLSQDTRPGDGEFDLILATEDERARLVHYLEHWQENRERLAMLPTRRGKRLRIEWTGFELHIDDKLRPKEDAKPKEMSGVVEARLDGDTVEFLVPDGRSKS